MLKFSCVWNKEKTGEMMQKSKGLSEGIYKHFLPVPPPDKFCNEAGQIMPMVCIDCLRIADIDWLHLEIGDLKGFDETAFFLSSEAIRYIGPKIMDLVLIHGEKALDVEFVDSFLFLPYAKNIPTEFLNAFNDEEHKLYKEFYLQVLTSHAENGVLSWALDASEIIKKYPL